MGTLWKRKWDKQTLITPRSTQKTQKNKYIKEKDEDRQVTQALNYEQNRADNQTFFNTIRIYGEQLQAAHGQATRYDSYAMVNKLFPKNPKTWQK